MERAGLLEENYQKEYYGKMFRRGTRTDRKVKTFFRNPEKQKKIITFKRKKPKVSLAWHTTRKVFPRFCLRYYVNFPFGIRVGHVPPEFLNNNLNDWEMIAAILTGAKRLKKVLEQLDKGRKVDGKAEVGVDELTVLLQ